MATGSPVIPYTAREYETALAALIAFVQSTNSGLVSDFTQSNMGMMLLQLAAATVEVISASQDFASAECFLSSCRTYEAAIRVAKSVGYVPKVATPAIVTVICNPLPSAVTTNGATVSAGQVITVGGLNYRLLADVTIPSGQSTWGFSLVQVDVFSETFAPTNLPFQKITTANGVVSQDSWSVYIGDATNPENEWTQVDDVLLLTGADHSYQVSVDAQGRLSASFGDGNQGAVPTQTITVNYQTTSGAAGNLPIFGVTGSLVATYTGGTASLTVSNSNGAATGGQDRETLDQLKRNIPAYIRTNQRVVTLQDYEDFLSQQAGVALTYADISVASYSVNVVKAYCWASENVTFVAESAKSGMRSSVPYARYAQIPGTQAATLHQALQTKTMATTYNRVLRPTIAYADLYVGDIRYDSRYDPVALHQSIAAAVVEVFEDGNGFTIGMNEINNAIRDVAGVKRFNIQRVVWDALRGGFPTGSITFSGNPADGDTVSINDGVRGYAYEFDSNSSIASGRIRVAIGNSPESTATNLINAINQTIAIRAYRNPTLGGPTVSLVHTRIGDTFNLPIAGNSTVLTVSGMSGGTYDRVLVREDRRLDQNPIPDPYPIGTYTVGDGGGNGWAAGGVAPYYALNDLEVKAVKSARALYDEQYLFNNEIRYDAGVELTPDVQAINLRRLVFDLVPDNRTTLGY